MKGKSKWPFYALILDLDGEDFSDDGEVMIKGR